MPSTLSAQDMLDREFLDIRCRIIDIAAALDRIDASPGASAALSDPRVSAIKNALATLPGDGPDRAERVQMIFSDAYDENWRAS